MILGAILFMLCNNYTIRTSLTQGFVRSLCALCTLFLRFEGEVTAFKEDLYSDLNSWQREVDQNTGDTDVTDSH